MATIAWCFAGASPQAGGFRCFSTEMRVHRTCAHYIQDRPHGGQLTHCSLSLSLSVFPLPYFIFRKLLHIRYVECVCARVSSLVFVTSGFLLCEQFLCSQFLFVPCSNECEPRRVEGEEFDAGSSVVIVRLPRRLRSFITNDSHFACLLAHMTRQVKYVSSLLRILILSFEDNTWLKIKRKKRRRGCDQDRGAEAFGPFGTQEGGAPRFPRHSCSR